MTSQNPEDNNLEVPDAAALLETSMPMVFAPDRPPPQFPVRRVTVEIIEQNPRVSPERYELLQEIGRGGVGVIYRARDRELGRDLVVKILHERHRRDRAALMRFVEEAQIVGHLHHSGVAPILDVGCFADGTPYFAMNLVEGRTLGDLLAQRIGAHERKAYFLGCFAKICQVIAYAHARGVIHGELKPANIMVGSFGEVQVMDWGMARVLAPEQARGAVELREERTDVFGLGAILCEIMTGEPPFGSGSAREVFERAQAGELTRALSRLDRASFDRELVSLARRCLAGDPASSPRHAGIVADEVSAYLAVAEERARGAQLVAATLQEQAEAKQKSLRLRITLAATALVVLLVLIALVWWIRERKQTHTEQVALVASAALVEAEKFRAEARSSHPEGLASWTRASAAVERALELTTKAAVDEELKARIAMLKQDIEEEHAAAGAESLRFERNRQAIAALETLQSQHGGNFAWALEAPAYAATLKAHGIDVDASVEAAAVQIQASGIAPQIARALDHMAHAERWLHPERPDGWRKWVELARRCESDPLRNRIRQAFLDDNLAALEGVAAAPELIAADRDTRHLLDACLMLIVVGRSRLAESLASLRQISATLLEGPRNGSAWEQAAGLMLSSENQLEAIVALRQAVMLKPDDAELQCRLGGLLVDAGFATEAVAVLDAATQLEPRREWYWFVLAGAHEARGDLDEALRSAQRAVAAGPEEFRSILRLARLLKELGRCEEALPLMERGSELARAAPAGVPAGVEKWPGECRERQDLDALADAYRQGSLKPASNEQRLQLAEIFQQRQLLAAAAQYFAEAFSRDPSRILQYFLAAARVATQAGSGRGTDAAATNAEERALFLRQALAWLRVGVEASQQANKEPRQRHKFYRDLRLLLGDILLAPLRDPGTLASLAQEEQDAFASFWRGLESQLSGR